MTMEGEGELGAVVTAARSSGKALQCHVLNPHSSGCVISGGGNPIADGQSTTVDSKVVSLKDTEAIATNKTVRFALRVLWLCPITAATRSGNLNVSPD